MPTPNWSTRSQQFQSPPAQIAPNQPPLNLETPYQSLLGSASPSRLPSNDPHDLGEFNSQVGNRKRSKSIVTKRFYWTIGSSLTDTAR
ncbi:MAG: hypothetical protein U0930_11975 [Pirellulales bacterium]